MPPERHPLNLLDSYPPGSRHRRGHPVYRRLLSFAPRPRVSNDNAHAEALFRTAKYHPTLPPKGFADLESARQWACSFVHTYNYYHRHSALRFVTPAEKHSGGGRAILCRRGKLYKNAQNHRPDRWFRKTTRNWTPVTTTSLHPIDPRVFAKTSRNQHYIPYNSFDGH